MHINKSDLQTVLGHSRVTDSWALLCVLGYCVHVEPTVSMSPPHCRSSLASSALPRWNSLTSAFSNQSSTLRWNLVTFISNVYSHKYDPKCLFLYCLFYFMCMCQLKTLLRAVINICRCTCTGMWMCMCVPVYVQIWLWLSESVYLS